MNLTSHIMTADCVTANWPKWLADINVFLFDAEVGIDDEGKARAQFALDVAKAVSVPRNFEKALDLFLIATVQSVKVHDKENVTQPVIDLLHRRIAGENVDHEMKDARAAARAANGSSYAAKDAAARAADYAAYDAYDENYVACATYAAARAAARAAANDVNAATARAAERARADLITAINQS